MALAKRLKSLDVFRGMTIAGMILVNNPGSWSSVHTPLLHAKWHGATPTDWVFPFFLFIVGVSIALALGRRKAEGADKSAIVRKILRRSALIFSIGLLLHLFPYFRFSSLRIPGVLQRIALVYLAASLIFLYFKPRTQFWIAVGLLLGYWGLMTLVPVPGGHPPNLDPETNLGAWLDRLLLSGHLWSQSLTWDPEGLLSTMPAVATGISGVLSGIWLRNAERTDFEKVAGLMTVGLILLGVAYVWDTMFPINKALWTSSYVCYSSGLAMLIFGAIYYVVDLKGYQKGIQPFVVYGMNALFVYTMSGLVAKTLFLIKFGEEKVSAWSTLYQSLYVPVFSNPKNASLAFALTHVLFFWLLAYILYRNKIFIKV